MCEEVHLKKSDDYVAELSEPRSIKEPDTSPSLAKAKPILKEEKAEEKTQTPSSSESFTPINSSDGIILNSNATPKEFGRNYLEITEEQEMILMPQVIEISTPPSPTKTEVISENNDTKDPINIQDPTKKKAGFHSSASAKELHGENTASKSLTEKYHMTSLCKPTVLPPIDEYMEKTVLKDSTKILDQAQSESDSQTSSAVYLPNNKDVHSDSTKECLDENASKKSMVDYFHLTSLSKPIDLLPSSPPNKNITWNEDKADPIGIQDQTQNRTSFQSSTPVNLPESSDSSKLESGTIEIIQFISLPKLIEITPPPSPNKSERSAENMESDELIEAKEQEQFEMSSQSSTYVNLQGNFTKTERKGTSFPRQDQTERNSCPSNSSNLPSSNTTESPRELNEDVKLEHGAVEKPQPPPIVRPGILKHPTVKEIETETTMTKSEFAELLGKLISAIKVEEGVEITVEELSDEIFYYFGGNKEIMEIRLSGEYAAGIISKLTEQEPSEKKSVRKCVTFAPETEEVEIEPRQRSRSNSLVDKSTEKLKTVRSFIEKIFHL